MDPVVHFEMPFEDQKRVSGFYKAAFGWKMEDTGEEMGNYVTAATAETGPQGRPKAPGAINGGFFPKKPDWPAQYPSVVIGVGDIKKAMQKVAKAGGKVLGEPMEIPGIGQYVSFTDTEGNRVSLLQPVPMGKPAKAKPVAKKAKTSKTSGSTKTTKKKAVVGKKRR
jgi:predicted enzyme related to lactoylglutathione lyase